MGKRVDWSRRLPRPLVIPKVMKLTTLADVRELMRHLPKEHRERSTWRMVADDLEAAARGADPADVALALRLVLRHSDCDRPKPPTLRRRFPHVSRASPSLLPSPR